MLFDILALTFGTVHFAIPLAYYIYLKRYAKKPWNLKIDESYRPKSTIIIPTYNEAEMIEQRLDDTIEQDYPKEKLELILIDSASDDGTPEIVERWMKKHPYMNVKLIREKERRGKVYALNNALSKVSDNAEIVIVTDADCLWRKDAVKNAVKYFGDPIVGAVTCSIYPMQSAQGLGFSFDKEYRDFNNTVRIAESKSWSTPIAHGPFIAYRRKCLAKLGGIPNKGVDDSTPFTLIALNGHRSIQAPGIYVYEFVPGDLKSGLARRLRRAHHLISHFAKMVKNIPSAPNPFKKILGIEIYLHTMNPWLLPIAMVLIAVSMVTNFRYALLSIGFWASILGAMLFTLYPSFRTWILTQFLMIGATINYMLKGELHMWKPISRREWTPKLQ